MRDLALVLLMLDGEEPLLECLKQRLQRCLSSDQARARSVSKLGPGLGLIASKSEKKSLISWIYVKTALMLIDREQSHTSI
jgi:hypothetical protein